MTELDERMHDLKNELQTFEGEKSDDSHKEKAIDALKRMENWNLFSDTYEVCYLICSWFKIDILTVYADCVRDGFFPRKKGEEQTSCCCTSIFSYLFSIERIFN